MRTHRRSDSTVQRKAGFLLVLLCVVSGFAVDLGIHHTPSNLSEFGQYNSRYVEWYIRANPFGFLGIKPPSESYPLWYYDYMPAITNTVTFGTSHGKWQGTAALSGGGFMTFLAGQGEDPAFIAARVGNYAVLDKIKIGGNVGVSAGRTIAPHKDHFVEGERGNGYYIVPEFYYSFSPVYTVGIHVPLQWFDNYSYDTEIPTKFVPAIELENSWGGKKVRFHCGTAYGDERFSLNLGMSVNSLSRY